MKKESISKTGMMFVLALLIVAAVFGTKVSVNAASSIKNATVTAQRKGSGTNSLSIKWKKVSSAQGYIVYRRAEGEKKYKRIAQVSSGRSYYADRNLKSGKIYRYRVLAYRTEKGKKVYSKYATLETATRPAKISKVTVTALSGSKVKIHWLRIKNVDGYRIYRKPNGGSWELVNDVPSSPLTFIDATASAKTKYVYAVRAYRKAGGVKYLGTMKKSAKIKTTGKSTPVSNSAFNSYQKDVMKKILYAVETGGQIYGNQRYDDFTEAYTNSSAEHAITIGAGQWYATEAQRLLKLIHDTMGEETYKQYDPKGYVWKDVQNENWSTYKLKKTTNRAKIIVKLISSPIGIKCQDQLMYQQIDEYEKEVRNLGVTDIQAVGMFINFRHQGGYGAVTRILKKTAKPYNLVNVYKAIETDTGNQVGAYKTRQAKVYNWLLTYMK